MRKYSSNHVALLSVEFPFITDKPIKLQPEFTLFGTECIIYRTVNQHYLLKAGGLAWHPVLFKYDSSSCVQYVAH